MCIYRVIGNFFVLFLPHHISYKLIFWFTGSNETLKEVKKRVVCISKTQVSQVFGDEILVHLNIFSQQEIWLFKSKHTCLCKISRLPL